MSMRGTAKAKALWHGISPPPKANQIPLIEPLQYNLIKINYIIREIIEIISIKHPQIVQPTCKTIYT